MGNEKDVSYSAKKNMAMKLVPKRGAVMRGLSNPGCQFDTWLTSVAQVGLKER